MGYSILSLSDVGSNNLQKESKDFYLDMTDFYVNNDFLAKILRHSKPITVSNDNDSEEPTEVTILDLFNLPFEEDKEIKRFIKDRLKIDIDTEEGIKKINELFEKAIKLYEERYLRVLPPKFKARKFNNSTSLIAFLRETKSNKKSGLLNCAIAKIAFSMSDVLSSEKVRRSAFIENQFIDNIAIPLQITESHERNGVIYRKGKVVFDDNFIASFYMIVRTKKINSIVGKEVATPKYYAIEQFQDFVGATFYVENEESALRLMQYLDQSIYNGKAKVESKGHTINDCEANFLNDAFKKKAKNAMLEKDETEEDAKNKGSSEDFKGMKLKGDVNLPFEEGKNATKFPVGAEIQFVIGDQDNEHGVSLHSIYDYVKKFRELTRLGIPIRKLDILNYVNDFFINMDFYLSKKNKQKEPYLKELQKDLEKRGFLNNTENPTEKDLAIGLYKHLEGFLKKVKVGDTEFYVEKRALLLRDLGMHSKNIEDIKEAA